MRQFCKRWMVVALSIAALSLVLGLCGSPATAPSEAAPPRKRAQTIDFGRDIRPILAEACYQCHGPDAKQRDSELRLDRKQSAMAERDGRRAIVAGSPQTSELIRRILSQDDDERMPPADSSLRLSKQQINKLRLWIEQGAVWSEHWAFSPPVRLSPPNLEGEAQGQKWRRNDIDHFVWKRLAAEGLTPQQEASRETLIRRLSLDLTGLPPSLSELDAFLADRTPQAYERVVDRLLKSPHYGERMALNWLDAARYADTSGYQNDGPRDMWRWRDWVIEAFNNNLPFDQFTIQQLAGDLLDPAPQSETPAHDYNSAWRGALIRNPKRLNHLIASAFNRNHRGNAEGGIIADEYQVEYVVDRVDTTATVWLGLTLGCARCHDHKFDPIEQREFYSIFALFNNIPEFGRAIKEGNSPPYIKAPTKPQRDKLAKLEQAIRKSQQELASSLEAISKAQRQWETQYESVSEKTKAAEGEPTLIKAGLTARFSFDNDLGFWKAGPNKNADEDLNRNSRQASGPPAKLVTGAGQAGTATFAPGVIGRALELDGKSHIDAGDFADFGYFDKFTLAAWVQPRSKSGVIISRMTPEEQGDGYALELVNGRIQVNLVKRWLDDSIRVESKDTLPIGQWSHVAMTYDGRREPRGIHVYINGQSVKLRVNQDFINQTFAAKEQPVRIGGGGRSFTGLIDDARIYSRDLTKGEIAIIATPQSIQSLVAKEPSRRSAAERLKLRRHFFQHHAPAALKNRRDKLLALQAERRQLLAAMPTLMVMQEMKQPRQTRVLIRGQYDKPGDLVSPGLPQVLTAGQDQKPPRNRLDFARWLVDKRNPLTARVAVNRIWQMHFGVGLVETAEDFGVQGASPSHPLLLDWLAGKLIDSGWDLKQLHKLIVMSATYRQSSQALQALRERDPDNRLLARGARFRLSAETVRDQTLAISGLLTRRIGGPSVRPYQPDGLWKEIATDTNYEQSHGADLYRRSMYTYWKRTVAPPTMSTLDAPPREACTVKRSRTNTPLQALALMNETSFVEAARALAQKTLQSGSDKPWRFVFRSATLRQPTDKEEKVLMRALSRLRKQFRQQPDAAAKLIATGESAVDSKLDPIELAAYTMLASMVFNLDEVITRE